MKKIILYTLICAICLALCSCSLFVGKEPAEPTDTETEVTPKEDGAQKNEETDMDELGDQQTIDGTAAETETESETEHNIIVGDPSEDDEYIPDPDVGTSEDGDWELEGAPIG